MENVTSNAKDKQAYLRDRSRFCMRLGLQDRDEEKCSRRCARWTRSRKTNEEKRRDCGYDIFRNCGLRRKGWSCARGSDHCGIYGQLPEWAWRRADEGLRAGIGQRHRLQHHAVMGAAAATASRQTGVRLCAGKKRLQRQKGRQQQQNKCEPAPHCYRIPSTGLR